MNKNQKIIIIGFGSIGQRHYRNLTKLGYKNVFVFDTDPDKITGSKIKVVKKMDQDTLKQFAIAIICTPNNLHIKDAVKCAKAGCQLFIEKPLSHNLTGIDKLIHRCRSQGLVTMVGCNMRFHPCLKFIKEYLAKRKLGRVYSINHEFGYFLPYWRPDQDYRKKYASKKSTGGGIILDDIHEFDLLFWLNDFAAIKETKFIYDKVSNLNIETEDICIASFKFKNNVLGSVRCDYLQQDYSRSCKIVGEKGNLQWDFKENIVWLKNKQGMKKLLAVKNFDFNKVYLDEIDYFINCVNKKQSTFNDIKRADQVLKICFQR